MEDELTNVEQEEQQQEEQPVKPQRDFDKDRIYAAARREAESKANARLDAAAKAAGFQDYKSMLSDIETGQTEKLKDQIASGDMSAIDELLNFKIQSEFAPIREMHETMQAQQEKLQIEKDIRELNSRYPGLKTKAGKSIENEFDLFEVENGQEIVEAAASGVPLWRAFAAYNIDSIASTKAEAARQASKDHLKQVGGQAASGNVLTPIPKNEISTWQAAYPDEDLSKLTERYNRVEKIRKGG